MDWLTVSSFATIVGIIWQYWRIPVRFWQWYHAPETEPEVGQLWREASFSSQNRDMKVIECDEDHIMTRSTTDKDFADDYLELSLTWWAWERMVKARRLYCKEQPSMEDEYWGDLPEE